MQFEDMDEIEEEKRADVDGMDNPNKSQVMKNRFGQEEQNEGGEYVPSPINSDGWFGY